MSNYYKYYHLRASPIGKQEQQQQQVHGVHMLVPQPQVPQLNSANKQLSGSKQQQPAPQHMNHHRHNSAVQAQIYSQETSPWRGVSLPSGIQLIQSQIPSQQQQHQPQQQMISQVSTSPFNDKSLQQYALEKQNECLRKEKAELESQIQKLKIYYTKQSALDQSELMRYEREKASLADKLREMDDNLSMIKDRYEKESAGDKLGNRKQRQEWEGKLERITSYYNEQLALKQEEIQKSKNKIQLLEINNSDLAAKLKIFESTNKELRAKWDEDIKNFGQEVEAHNRQLLKERYRNDELERLQKMNRLGQQVSQTEGNESNVATYQKEIEVLRNSNAEKQSRILDLERRLLNEEAASKELRGSEGQSTHALKERLELKVQEIDRVRVESLKKSSEIEVLSKENASMQSRLLKLDVNHREKDVLVQQMLIHIEQLERENADLSKLNYKSTGSAQLEEKVQRYSSINQKQQTELDYLNSELQRLTKRNILLEDQLYNPNKLRLLQSNVESLEIKHSHLSIQVAKLNELSSRPARGSSVPSLAVVNATTQRDVNDLTREIEDVKRELKVFSQQPQQGVSSIAAVAGSEVAVSALRLTEGSRERLDTGDFSPTRERIDSFSPSSGSNGLVQQQQQEGGNNRRERNDKSYTSLHSEYKKVTIPQPLISMNQYNSSAGNEKNHEHSGELLDATDNSSQQTFGGNGKDAVELKQQQEQIEYLIQKTKEEQEELDLDTAKALLGGSDVNSENVPSNSLIPTDFQGSFGFGEPSHNNNKIIDGTNSIRRTGSVSNSGAPEEALIGTGVAVPSPVSTHQSKSSVPIEVVGLHPIRLDSELIELDINQVLNSQSSEKLRYQFEKQLEGKEVFDLVVGFIGCQGSGKSTVMNSVVKEEWDESVPKNGSCSKKMQLVRYPCMAKKVALVESDLIGDTQFMHFICNFTQALVLMFRSWDAQDERVFAEYVKLLQSEINFASELIVIHSDSHRLSAQTIASITVDLTKLQDGLYRGKLDGKLKKVNVYHLMLHNHTDKTKNKSIFEEVIAVCRGTIIGKLTSSKEKIDLFRKLNKFLTA